MAHPSGILIGTAGVYHVASRLAMMGYHAAVTHGNAPSVDILVGLRKGSASLALQVKTSHWAARTRGRKPNKKLYRYEWDVGQRAVSESSEHLFCVFVDLKILPDGTPQGMADCYVVPSAVIAKAFGSAKHKRPRWHLGAEEAHQYRDNWSVLDAYLKLQPDYELA